MVGLLSVSPGLELERLRQKNILYSAVISLMSYEKECPEKNTKYAMHFFNLRKLAKENFLHAREI